MNDAATAASSSVSIVICCYNLNRWRDLCAAIDSSVEQEPQPLDVVVVVDHNDELQRLVSTKFPSVVVIENRSERGLSGARNCGVEASSGALITFLDDDAVAEPGMIAALQKNMQDDRVLGAVANIVPEWLAGAPRWFPAEFLWVVGCSYRGLRPGRVRNLIGAAMCIRRSVFDRVGGFTTGVGRASSGLPLGCEETELCIRANAAHPDSWFVYDPSAVCRHKVPAQRSTWRYFATRCLAEGWSKAHIASLVDAKAALSTERSYVSETLLGGFIRGVRGCVSKGDVTAAANAIAIVFGLSVTILGYLTARIHFAVRSGQGGQQMGAVFAEPVLTKSARSR